MLLSQFKRDIRSMTGRCPLQETALDEVLVFCASQCWAFTNARQLQAPTLHSPWRAGGACWTGLGPQRRRSLCLAMLCPLNSLVRSNKQKVLVQVCSKVNASLRGTPFFHPQMAVMLSLLASSSTEILLLFFPSRGKTPSVKPICHKMALVIKHPRGNVVCSVPHGQLRFSLSPQQQLPPQL